MTETQLLALLGVILSLFFTGFPVVKDWFDALDSRAKVQVMAFCLLAIGVGVTGLSCADVISAVTCDQQNIVNFAMTSVVNAILAAAGNQATFLMTRVFNQKNEAGVG